LRIPTQPRKTTPLGSSSDFPLHGDRKLSLFSFEFEVRPLV
jgi:hypothetical protein